MLPALLTSVLWAGSSLAGRHLPVFFGGTQANVIRLLLAATLLGAYSELFGFGLHGPAYFWLFLSGAVGFGLGDLSMLQTYPHLGARRTMVMVQCLAVPFATLIEWLWLHQVPTGKDALYAVVILTGIGIAIMPAKSDEPTHGLKIGIFFGLLAALGQGGGAVVTRKAYAVAAASGHAFHGAGDGINAAYQRMTGGIAVSLLTLIYLRIKNRAQDARPANWKGGWPWLVGNTLAGPTIGVSCFQWALMTSPTSVVLPIVATSPLMVIPLTRIVDGERITKRAICGGAIAVAGVIGLTLAK